MKKRFTHQFKNTGTTEQRFTFSARERLKSRKQIGRLFAEGVSFGAFPLRVVWTSRPRATEDEPLAQVAFSVPQKRHKTAVTRNLLKRRVREAYRLSKHKLYAKIEQSDKVYALMFIYVDGEIRDYESIKKAVDKTIWRIGKDVDGSWKK